MYTLLGCSCVHVCCVVFISLYLSDMSWMWRALWGSGSFVFFKQKTAYEMRISDWSSDVCSSDLGRETDPDMAIVENRIVEAIGLFDLVQRLRDQESLDTIARHEGERALEEIQPSERRKFVEHQKQPP